MDAVVYLKLAQILMKSFQKGTVSIAEDVSGLPGLATSVWDGGIGFDYRLNMAIPDFWIKHLKDVRDEQWKVQDIGLVYLNVRSDERVISYCESHDQAIVGDKTISMWLFDREIYTNMSKLGQKTPVGARGIGLHKLIRFITLVLGDAYLNFMGNEFGHPEWVDFPRAENNFSYLHCRRQWPLADDNLLYYSDLKRFDEEMAKIDQKYNFLSKWRTMYANYHDEDKVITLEGGGVLVVFNFHSTKVPSQELHRLPDRDRF